MDGALLIEGSKLGAPEAKSRDDKVIILIHERPIGPIGPNDLLLGVDVGDIVGDCPSVLV